MPPIFGVYLLNGFTRDEREHIPQTMLLLAGLWTFTVPFNRSR